MIRQIGDTNIAYVPGRLSFDNQAVRLDKPRVSFVEFFEKPGGSIMRYIREQIKENEKANVE